MRGYYYGGSDFAVDFVDLSSTFGEHRGQARKPELRLVPSVPEADIPLVSHFAGTQPQNDNHIIDAGDAPPVFGHSRFTRAWPPAEASLMSRMAILPRAPKAAPAGPSPVALAEVIDDRAFAVLNALPPAPAIEAAPVLNVEEIDTLSFMGMDAQAAAPTAEEVDYSAALDMNAPLAAPAILQAAHVPDVEGIDDEAFAAFTPRAAAPAAAQAEAAPGAEEIDDLAFLDLNAQEKAPAVFLSPAFTAEEIDDGVIPAMNEETLAAMRAGGAAAEAAALAAAQAQRVLEAKQAARAAAAHAAAARAQAQAQAQAKPEQTVTQAKPEQTVTQAKPEQTVTQAKRTLSLPPAAAAPAATVAKMEAGTLAAAFQTRKEEAAPPPEAKKTTLKLKRVPDAAVSATENGALSAAFRPAPAPAAPAAAPKPAPRREARALDPTKRYQQTLEKVQQHGLDVLDTLDRTPRVKLSWQEALMQAAQAERAAARVTSLDLGSAFREGMQAAQQDGGAAQAKPERTVTQADSAFRPAARPAPGRAA